MHYTTSCNTQPSAPEYGRNNRPKHVELIGIINKPLLWHLVGCLYYFLPFVHLLEGVEIGRLKGTGTVSKIRTLICNKEGGWGGGRNITLMTVKFQNTTWCFKCINLVGQNTWQLNMRQVVKLDFWNFADKLLLQFYQ